MAAAQKQIVGPTSTVSWNGTDLSQYVQSITLDDSHEEVDVTGMGEAYREFIPGIGDASVQLTVLNDQVSTGPDGVMYLNYVNKTAGTLKWNPNTGGTEVYTMVCKIYSWPTGGAVGDALTMDVGLRNAGTAGLTRGTS